VFSLIIETRILMQHMQLCAGLSLGMCWASESGLHGSQWAWHCAEIWKSLFKCGRPSGL